MGNHELKGFARPVPVWRVLGEAAAKSRFAATRGKLPLVGRAQEMELMLDRWRLARAGEGQIWTTRLSRALRAVGGSIRCYSAYEPRKAACPAIHYNRAPHAGRTGFSFEMKHGGGVRHRAERVTQPPHRHWPIRGSSW